MNSPEIETLVYLGTAQLPKEDGQQGVYFLFQHAASYYQDGDWSVLSEELAKDLEAEGAVMLYGDDAIGNIADLDGLLVLLGDLREHTRLRKLPRQGYNSKVDFPAVACLGMNVRGGTRPRLSCGRSSLYSCSQSSVIVRTWSIVSNT